MLGVAWKLSRHVLSKARRAAKQMACWAAPRTIMRSTAVRGVYGMDRLTRRAILLAAPALAVAGTAPALPTVRLGNHTISRLIVGGNPVSANSHVSSNLS